MTALLEVTGLRVGPADRAPRVGPLDLVVEPGTATALLGPSGSGKTLALRGLIGFEPAVWIRARIGEAEMETLAPRARRRCLVYVHQEAVRFPGSVRDDLARVRGFGSGDEPEARIVEWFERAGLGTDLLERDTVSLSVGEMRRVAIVRALQVAPRVLLLDEPTAGLDEAAARRVADLVALWVGEAAGRGVLVATHDASFAERAASRFVVLTADGTVATTTTDLSEARRAAEALEAET